jgi:hypothetical protein
MELAQGRRGRGGQGNSDRGESPPIPVYGHATRSSGDQKIRILKADNIQFEIHILLELYWEMEQERGDADKQNLRESLSGGQHNSRSSKSHLQTIFPHFTFLPEMTEEDEMWVPEIWEKEDEGKMMKRVGEGFEQCLELSEGSTCEFPLLPRVGEIVTDLSDISVTSHKTATERLRLFLGMEKRVMGLCEMNILVLRVKKRHGGYGGDISGS